MKVARVFALSVVSLAISQALYAAQDVEMLDDVVVTATKTAKIASEAPATVTVVTAKEIENKNVHRMEEALAGAPGVFIRSLGGEQPSNWMNQITLRGIPGYYRTGILVDGVSINNAFSGGVNMSLVQIDDIKQIEVVPGPFSSLYGGAGMSGVVNIITKTPEKREISIAGDAGSHNFGSLDIGYRDKLSDTLGISLSYGHKDSDGYVNEYVTKTPAVGAAGTVVTGWQKTTTSTRTTTYLIGDKGREAWEQDNYGAKLFLTLSPVSRLVLSTSYLTSQNKDVLGNSYLTAAGVPFTNGVASIDGKDTTVRATDFLNTTNGEDLTRYAAAYETQFADDYKLKANLSYQNNEYWYTSITANSTNTSGPGKLSDIPADKIDGDVQVSFPVAGNQYMIVGASVNQSTLNKKVYNLANWRQTGSTGAFSDWADGNSVYMAVYAQDEIAISDKLTVYGGARYDRWTTDGAININNVLSNYTTRTSSAFNPKVSAVYKLEQGTIIKGAIGKAFRAPNLSDMYSTFGTTIISWSNPDLKPETVITAEIGAEHEFETGTLLRATYYQSDLSDLIYSTTTGANRYKFNAGKAETQGIDLEARQKLMGGLTAFVNATFVSTEITENAIRPTSVGHQIPLQAKKMANIGLEGSRGQWSGSIIGSYFGKMYSADDNTDLVNNVPGSYDPYFVANAKISYKIDNGLTASLSLKNLFDRKYFQSTSKADSRSVFLGLGFKY
ncbi:MAG: TonB-dependent receptor [Gallionella sp.]|nr:TonB-dependent receptor [Gallionella sp.]